MPPKGAWPARPPPAATASPWPPCPHKRHLLPAHALGRRHRRGHRRLRFALVHATHGCSWGKTGFSFAFDGIYNYGEGIANLGTYLPMEAPEAVSLGDNAEEMAAETDEADDGAPYLPVACAIPGTEAYSACLGSISQQARFPYRAGAATGSWCAAAASWQPVDLAGRRYAQLPSRRGSGGFQRFPRLDARGHAGRHLFATWTTPHRRRAAEALPRRIWEPAVKGALACLRSGREGPAKPAARFIPLRTRQKEPSERNAHRSVPSRHRCC